ncbi:MAG TPA: hypothetical protein VIJ25_20065 [Methylococcales bacterium]
MAHRLPAEKYQAYVSCITCIRTRVCSTGRKKEKEEVSLHTSPFSGGGEKIVFVSLLKKTQRANSFCPPQELALCYDRYLLFSESNGIHEIKKHNQEKPDF